MIIGVITFLFGALVLCAFGAAFGTEISIGVGIIASFLKSIGMIFFVAIVALLVVVICVLIISLFSSITNKTKDKIPVKIKTILKPLFYGCIPITFVCIVCAMIFFTVGPDSSVTFYNMSSIEDVDEIYVKQDNKDEWQKVFPKRSLKIQLKQNEKVGFRLDPGVYEFKIISHNTDESGNMKKYEISLAGNSAECEKGKELLLCYGGKNFYEFSKKDEVYKDGKLVDINKPASSPASVKKILEEAE